MIEFAVWKQYSSIVKLIKCKKTNFLHMLSMKHSVFVYFEFNLYLNKGKKNLHVSILHLRNQVTKLICSRPLDSSKLFYWNNWSWVFRYSPSANCLYSRQWKQQHETELLHCNTVCLGNPGELDYTGMQTICQRTVSDCQNWSWELKHKLRLRECTRVFHKIAEIINNGNIGITGFTT